nr:DUF177 domain-containing protein [Nanchangia anserum]
MCLDLRELPQRSGATLQRHVTYTVGEEWTTPVAHITPGVELDMDISLQAIDQGVLAHVRTRVPAEAECVRCLDRVDLTRDVDLYQVFYLPDERDKLVADGDEDAAYEPVIEGDAIDLTPVLRDATVGQLPLQPLCSEDCLGLCSTCGEPLRDLEDDHHHDVVDPRWSALAGLLGEVKETT